LPLYEYECLENGHRFELIRLFSDPPLRTCIKCKSKVERLLSTSAISFKGKGWYVTDYGKGNGGGAGAKSGKEDKGGSTESPSKSDAPKSDSSSKPDPPKKESKPSGSDSK